MDEVKWFDRVLFFVDYFFKFKYNQFHRVSADF